MLFGLIRRQDALKDILDRERRQLFAELLDEAVASEEIRNSGMSAEDLRADATAAQEEVLRSAAAEEQALRDSVHDDSEEAYENRHYAGPTQLFQEPASTLVVVLQIVLLFGGIGAAAWLLTYDESGSVLWSLGAAVVALLASFGAWGATYSEGSRTRVDRAGNLLLFIFGGVGAAYAGYRIAGGGWFGGVFATILATFAAAGYLVIEHIMVEQQVRLDGAAPRYAPTSATKAAYEEWRRVLGEGVRGKLRSLVNEIQLSRYSTVLSVRDAPGLRYLGDLKYHVPTAARDELINRLSAVDGGSFALAGPRGAGKTILLRALCEGRYSDHPGRDLGVVVSAPVDYQSRDFVLYLYTEICKATKDYFAQPSARSGGLLRRPRADTPQHLLVRRADRELIRARHLQTFSTELSAKGGVKFAELSAKTATSLAEQPLTYPEIVADLRSFLQAVAAGVDGRVLIGIDELDRIGSAERARKFLDDIKAIFWVRGCYFLISVSEDALRAFELSGHGLRDAFDSAFDEVVVVEHLDFEACTALLRARVTGMPLPYHALAYCLSGGLPRELMRSARAIVDQRPRAGELRIGQVTANLVAGELARHSRAARLALAESGSDAAMAAELLRRLDEGCPPTDAGLCDFAADVIKAASPCSEVIRSLADMVATHARYLAAMAAVFCDGLTERDIQRATDEGTPVEGRFDTLARARRYLGVNDAFARMLVDGFREAWG